MEGEVATGYEIDDIQVIPQVNTCRLRKMSFWRASTSAVIADIDVGIDLFLKDEVIDDTVKASFRVALHIDMDEGEILDCNIYSESDTWPERDMWVLDDYLVPFLRKDEIEAGTETLLEKYYPEALGDLKTRKAYALAERMGLSVMTLPGGQIALFHREAADRRRCHDAQWKARWTPKRIENVLTNEKYKGDALLQKKFTVDFLTKKTKVNEGEVPQYYVEGSHPAIIPPEKFDAVQAEMQRRKANPHRFYTPHCFSGYIFCEDCGGLYGSKTWHSTDCYKKVVWQCNAKYKHEKLCQTPLVHTEEMQAAFVQAINRVVGSKAEIIDLCEKALNRQMELDNLSKQMKSPVRTMYLARGK